MLYLGWERVSASCGGVKYLEVLFMRDSKMSERWIDQGLVLSNDEGVASICLGQERVKTKRKALNLLIYILTFTFGHEVDHDQMNKIHNTTVEMGFFHGLARFSLKDRVSSSLIQEKLV